MSQTRKSSCSGFIELTNMTLPLSGKMGVPTRGTSWGTSFSPIFHGHRKGHLLPGVRRVVPTETPKVLFWSRQHGLRYVSSPGPSQAFRAPTICLGCPSVPEESGVSPGRARSRRQASLGTPGSLIPSCEANKSRLPSGAGIARPPAYLALCPPHLTGRGGHSALQLRQLRLRGPAGLLGVPRTQRVLFPAGGLACSRAYLGQGSPKCDHQLERPRGSH